jgi:hypothetical protein
MPQGEEAGGDHLLCAALGRRRREAPPREQPQDDQRGERLDERVDAESDQRYRGRGQSGAESDSELDHVPADPTQASPRACRSSFARFARCSGVRRGVS